ncbi:tetratricopeptide repeat protein [Candidatus Poribacteria bacterium]|nr:tetratricopeptide repeat protein [Candidatus Poribacteria bacterium]
MKTKQITAITFFLFVVANSFVIADVVEREQHKRDCMENLRAIGKAIEAYKADHKGELPNWLSDLYPKYLQDTNLLLCPADKDKGVPAAQKEPNDPKMSCSYNYEFSPAKCPGVTVFDTNPPKEMTYKEAKTRQLKYFGGMTPVVRCSHHGEQWINLSCDGKVYVSPWNWEGMPEAVKAVLSSFQSAVSKNPDGWEKELSVKGMYDYFSSLMRLSDLLAVLEKAPNLSADALKIMSDIYRLHGEIDKEMASLKRLLRLQGLRPLPLNRSFALPDNTELRLRLAELYAMKKNYQSAREQCQQIIRTDPDNSRANALLLELDAVADGRRIQERLSKTRAKDPELHYLTKLEEMLLASKEDARSRVRKMQDIAQESFGEPASVTRLAHLYGKLGKSFSNARGQLQTYNSSDGLINNFVHSFAQDARGILWIGTGAGVCQYNGEAFIPFKTDKELDKGTISSILINKEGHIWFGMGDFMTRHGVFRYDGQNIVNYKAADGLVVYGFLRRIFQSSDGAIWFLYWGDGLTRYDGKSFRNFTTKDGLAGDDVYAIVEDSQGILWMGTNNGVSKYDGKTFTNLREADGLVGNYVHEIIKDHKGNLWLATNKGISRYDGKSFTTVEGGFGYISDGLEDCEGNLWFTAWDNGIFCYDGKNFTNLTEQDGLAINTINTIFEDREGNIWLGYDFRKGLSKFNPGLKNYGVEDGLAGTHVYCIVEDSKGNLWISTSREVCMYDGKTFTQPILNSRRALGPVYRILPDSKGNLWFATVREHWSTESERGIVRFDGKNYRRFTTLDGLPSNNVSCMMEDSNGNIWMGAGTRMGLGSKGVSRYDGKVFTNFTKTDGLVNDDVVCLTEDGKGNIWMGTWYGGVSRYDGTGFTNFTTDDGLADNDVHSIFTDKQGRVWFGAFNGLSIYDGKSFSTLPQFAGKWVMEFIEDGKGYLWFASQGDGVFKTDGKVFAQITKSDGLPTNEAQTLFEDRHGNIWIGTREGLTRYIPNTVPPLTHIESVKADRVYTATDTVRFAHQRLRLMVSLPASVRRFTINYRAVSFRTRPEAMQYFYQLRRVGIAHPTDDWQGPIRGRSVDYAGLKPGKYTFRVKAVDMDLNYSEPAFLSIVINAPPFYQTGIFLVALSIIGGASLIGIAILAIQRWRLSNAEKQHLQQELEDAHRMQLRLLPESAPTVEGFDIAGFSRPAREVGGDFFDYLSVADGKLGIALADVSGKGLKGAMNAVLANGMLHEAAKNETSCGKILSELNADLHPRIEKQMFTALGLAILDADGKTLQWANAAQPHPMVKRGEEVFEFQSDGALPLGMMRNVAYSDWELELQAGDVVIFYTDGIIEAANEAGEMYETERLEQVVTHIDATMNAEKIIEAILQDVAGFVGTAEQYDDMTAVVVRKNIEKG